MTSTPSKTSSKPPQTPTRLLLERIRRRSSIGPSQLHIQPKSQSNPHPLSHQEDLSLSIFPNQTSDDSNSNTTPTSSPLKQQDIQEEDYDDCSQSQDVPDDQVKEVEAIEAHFDQLLLHSTRYENEINDQKAQNLELNRKYSKLKKTNEDLQRSVSTLPFPYTSLSRVGHDIDF